MTYHRKICKPFFRFEGHYNEEESAVFSLGGQLITKDQRPNHSIDVMPLDYIAWDSLRRVVNGKDGLESVGQLKRMCRKWQSCWSDAEIVRLCGCFHSRLERVVNNRGGYIEGHSVQHIVMLQHLNMMVRPHFPSWNKFATHTYFIEVFGFSCLSKQAHCKNDQYMPFFLKNRVLWLTK